MDAVQNFYDEWAKEYHLIFADWKESIKRQGQVLDDLVHSELDSGARTILDCTCGIGTQSIGLAAKGHKVTSTDLSPKAVARAVREAEGFGIKLSGKVADLRKLDEIVSESFDVVLSRDNSICHLVEEDDLFLAMRQMFGEYGQGGSFSRVSAITTP